jgi:hypothetical protein
VQPWKKRRFLMCHQIPRQVGGALRGCHCLIGPAGVDLQLGKIPECSGERV